VAAVDKVQLVESKATWPNAQGGEMMAYLTTFLIVAICALIISLLMSAHQIPVGTNAQGRLIVVTHRPFGFCLVVAFVIAVLVTFLVHSH
jgi:uncharacterized Tic20 family protein